MRSQTGTKSEIKHSYTIGDTILTVDEKANETARNIIDASLKYAIMGDEMKLPIVRLINWVDACHMAECATKSGKGVLFRIHVEQKIPSSVTQARKINYGYSRSINNKLHSWIIAKTADSKKFVVMQSYPRENWLRVSSPLSLRKVVSIFNSCNSLVTYRGEYTSTRKLRKLINGPDFILTYKSCKKSKKSKSGTDADADAVALTTPKEIAQQVPITLKISMLPVTDEWSYTCATAN